MNNFYTKKRSIKIFIFGISHLNSYSQSNAKLQNSENLILLFSFLLPLLSVKN